MKKRVFLLSFAVAAMLTVGYSPNSNAQDPIIDDGGKKCKNDERCWNGNTVECDEFGDGLECVCYTC